MIRHTVFLDGATGYLGRWMLFWLLADLRDERVAVLIRPRESGGKAQASAQQRLEQVLESIGMTSERHRVTAIPGELGKRDFNNPDVMGSLRADCWVHMAGDVTFKKLGDRSATRINRDYTENFIETAKHTASVPRTLCHTSTFYVFEKPGTSADPAFEVPEQFHDPAQMHHHNAYGYSKLEAETYLQQQVRSLPFNLLIFRPDIVMHHIPVPTVAHHKQGLIVDDFKVVYQLIASLVGQISMPLAGPSQGSSPIRYLPIDSATVLNLSDVDSIAKAMMQLALLYTDGGFNTDDHGQIFHLVNRWRPVTCAVLRHLCAAIDPVASGRVKPVTPDEFQTQILPQLSWPERLFYTNFVDPFLGYMNRVETRASTANVDTVLGEAWHNLHPSHGIDVEDWLKAGATQAVEKEFGQSKQRRDP